MESDPHVVKILKQLCKTQDEKDAVLGIIEQDMVKLGSLASLSPILYEAAFDNRLESVLFDFFASNFHPNVQAEEHNKKLQTAFEAAQKSQNDEIEKKRAAGEEVEVPPPLEMPPLAKINHKLPSTIAVPGAPVFDSKEFMRLVRRIKQESPSFFPLRSLIDFHTIGEPVITLIGPGYLYDKRYDDIDTAAATADGIFLFNVPFMQGLLNFAHVKKLKIKDTKYGKKYEQNGGDFPDEYEYLEFLIRHEFMHYTYSDFHYGKIIPNAVPKIINWVGDFRSNHQLVQMGLNQIPMGLFSSYVNYHKQSSYMEMYKLVKSEFDKLPKSLQDMLDKLMQGDDHSKQGEKADGTEKTTGRQLSPDQIDAHNKKVNDKVSNDKTGEPGKKNPPSPSTQKGSPGTGTGSPVKIDYKNIKPKYKWDVLLKKMVSSTGTISKPSYQKISRRAIGAMHQVITTKRGAMKPGELVTPSRKKIKLAIIIDSSGSMSGAIETVMSNLDKLLVQREAVVKLHEEFFLFMFSGDYDIFECSPGKNGSARHVKDTKGTPGEHGSVALTDVLNQHKAGGTVFDSKLASEISSLAARGYNCLVVTDTDLLHGENFVQFKKLYSAHRKQIFLLLDSQESFNAYVGAMKEITDNASHL